MEIRTLQTFQVVAEELNMTKAAIKLNYSQPTITKHIQSLETELGSTLLIKRNGKYLLTKAGEELYMRSINILKEINLIKNISPDQGNHISLQLQGHDYYGFRYFMPAINKMAKTNETVTFTLNGASNEETISKILKNEIDLGIITGKVASSDLITKQIAVESTALCIHHSIFNPEYSLEDYFSKYPIVIDQSEYYNYDNSFQQCFNQPTIINTSSDEIVQEAILSGKMLGIVRTGRLQEYIDSGTINIIEVIAKEEPIQVIMNKSNCTNQSISTLFNFVCQQGAHNTPKLQTIKWA
ncbi:LysR family transcriptional regulator [Vagococcus hydrophili]|uniref:LysR family transcriptional regulator n=1 Tax=Vagococcus hydrophili TaxID=2714947 RepID=A0A6G8AXE7_9ENTE|nr:LysR family transcriptional regulator [Vagococcus hydrophili]QIL49625.1 LysR family transcriptional regulator [Vagococcus hydrophili]